MGWVEREREKRKEEEGRHNCGDWQIQNPQGKPNPKSTGQAGIKVRLESEILKAGQEGS